MVAQIVRVRDGGITTLTFVFISDEKPSINKLFSTFHCEFVNILYN